VGMSDEYPLQAVADRSLVFHPVIFGTVACPIKTIFSDAAIASLGRGRHHHLAIEILTIFEARALETGAMAAVRTKTQTSYLTTVKLLLGQSQRAGDGDT
jgi:hypothetical protein